MLAFQIFDPSLKKKKKKKKTTFDIDAALGDGGTPEGADNSDVLSTDKENLEPTKEPGNEAEVEGNQCVVNSFYSLFGFICVVLTSKLISILL